MLAEARRASTAELMNFMFVCFYFVRRGYYGINSRWFFSWESFVSEDACRRLNPCTYVSALTSRNFWRFSTVQNLPTTERIVRENDRRATNTYAMRETLAGVTSGLFAGWRLRLSSLAFFSRFDAYDLRPVPMSIVHPTSNFSVLSLSSHNRFFSTKHRQNCYSLTALKVNIILTTSILIVKHGKEI